MASKPQSLIRIAAKNKVKSTFRCFWVFGNLQIHKVKSTPNPISLKFIFYRCAFGHGWWQQWNAEAQPECGHIRQGSLALGSGNCSFSLSPGLFYCGFLIPWFRLQKQTRQSNWLQPVQVFGFFFFPSPNRLTEKCYNLRKTVWRFRANKNHTKMCWCAYGWF